MTRIECKDRTEWLSSRGKGIGGSDAAAILGLSSFKTPISLWRLKVGMDKDKDLSENEAVARGVRLEPAIRELFKAEHEEFDVEYHQFDILKNEEYPFIFATLDGEITDRETGKKGVLEIKTSEPNSKLKWEEWDGRIPDTYYVQVLHQLLATGYDFVIVKAYLINFNGDKVIREYRFDREDKEEELSVLLEEEKKFWDSVVSRRPPSVPLGGI